MQLLFQMDIELPIKKSDGGYKAYYVHKTENLQVVISEKMQDLRRLQAQRNELNAKGNCLLFVLSIIWSVNMQLSWIIVSTRVGSCSW